MGRRAFGTQEIVLCFQKFVAILEKCEGIDVDSDLSRPISGAEFSWQDMQSTDSWNCANLTPMINSHMDGASERSSTEPLIDPSDSRRGGQDAVRTHARDYHVHLTEHGRSEGSYNAARHDAHNALYVESAALRDHEKLDLGAGLVGSTPIIPRAAP